MTRHAAALASDRATWDRFVADSETGGYLQLGAWAEVKARNGWRAERIVVDGTAGPLGVQLLVRRAAPLPWSVGYAPRGPVGAVADAEAVVRLTDAIRRAARRTRVAEVTLDPAVEPGHPLEDALAAAGWRRSRSIQADRSRIVDLTIGERALWAALRPKWRQYVNGAIRAGVTIEDAGRDGLNAFHAIYAETARRAGFIQRARSSYEGVYDAFADVHGARLLLAREPDGTPSAVLFLLACGSRVVEPYGGMTTAGAASRANYLLKWEAIRSSAAAGARSYDMWGLSHPGIEQFKAGFGGRDVQYTGGWSLRLDPLGAAVIGGLHGVGVVLARARLRRRSGRVAAAEGGG